MDKATFEALPEETKKDIRSTLRAFSSVHVVYEYGRYKANTGICVQAVYAPDHRYVGEVHKDDIYTHDEQIVNYIECFLCYPIEYKGDRNYAMLRHMEAMRQNGKEPKIYLENGTAKLKKESEDDE